MKPAKPAIVPYLRISKFINTFANTRLIFHLIKTSIKDGTIDEVTQKRNI